MKIKRNLKKNKRVLQYLLDYRRPHRRMNYCQKPTPQKPKWWLRKMRKREQKRIERLEKVMAKYQKFMKKKKLTQKERKLKMRREFLSGLYKTIKSKLPRFRMLYRMVNIDSPLPHEIHNRKHIKKRRMLALFKKEHNILCSEISFLMSTSAAAASTKIVWTINKLTREKMFWDHVFNDVQALLRLLNKKIAENGVNLEKLQVRMTKTYFDRKAKDRFMATQPVYFGEIEYHLYPEKKIHTRKTLKQCYLEDLAEIEGLYMALEKEGDLVHHYLRTRELFVDVLNKILSKLNKGKKVVLDLLQDGHNVMNELTNRIYDLLRMKQITKKVTSNLEVRKKQAMNEKAILLQQTRELMMKHRPYQFAKMWVEESQVVADPKKSVDELNNELKTKYEMFQKAILIMGGILDKGSLRISDFTKISELWWIPEVKKTFATCAFIMRKISFPLIEAKGYIKRSEKAQELIQQKKKMRTDLRNRVIKEQKTLKPILYATRKAGFRVRRRFMKIFKKWKFFIKPIQDFYGLLKKKTLYNSSKLGIHNKMIQFNKIMCLKTLIDSIPHYLAKLVHTEKYIEDRNQPYNNMVRKRDLNRNKWKRYQLMKKLIYPQTEYIRSQQFFTIQKHPPLNKSPCPLCCVQERLSKMAIVEQYEDRIRSVYEIQCELRDMQHTKDLQDLIHPIWECKQPAARFLIQLLILEDRTRNPGKIMDFTKITK